MSLSGETEYIDDYVVVIEWVLLAEVSIVFGVPEATGRHVETTIALLQNDHVGCKLEVFVDFLQDFDDTLTGVVAPLLRFFAFIVLSLELRENDVVNLLLDR